MLAKYAVEHSAKGKHSIVQTSCFYFFFLIPHCEEGQSIQTAYEWTVDWG